MTPESGFLESYLPYVLRRADQTLSASFYAVLADGDVGRSEWRVLAVLEDLGQFSLLELADAALSPQPTVTHAVQRLEARGLVQRTHDQRDRRVRLVSITDSGSELTRSLIAKARQLEAAAVADLADIGELTSQLRALTEAVERQQQTQLEKGA